MLPVDFVGSNIVMNRPSDMTDEQCGSVYARRDVDENNFPYIVTAWMPSKEDLEAVSAGRPIYIAQYGQGMQPMSVWTTDENNETN